MEDGTAVDAAGIARLVEFPAGPRGLQLMVVATGKVHEDAKKMRDLYVWQQCVDLDRSHVSVAREMGMGAGQVSKVVERLRHMAEPKVREST